MRKEFHIQHGILLEQVESMDLGIYSETITGGTIFYSEINGVLKRRHIVLSTGEGAYTHFTDQAPRKVRTINGKITHPIMITGGKDIDFLIYVHPTKGVLSQGL